MKFRDIVPAIDSIVFGMRDSASKCSYAVLKSRFLLDILNYWFLS